MSKSSTTFKPGNKAAPHHRRRVLSESLTHESLSKHGSKMLEILVEHAMYAAKPDLRVRAADRFLCHTLLQPKDGLDASTDERNAEAFVNAGLTLEQACRVRDKVRAEMAQLLTVYIDEEKGKGV